MDAIASILISARFSYSVITELISSDASFRPFWVSIRVINESIELYRNTLAHNPSTLYCSIPLRRLKFSSSIFERFSNLHYS